MPKVYSPTSLTLRTQSRRENLCIIRHLKSILCRKGMVGGEGSPRTSLSRPRFENSSQGLNEEEYGDEELYGDEVPVQDDGEEL